MWFTSKVGEGSTFSFTICAPVTDLATLAEIAGRRRSIVPPTKRMSQDYTINILVAEDNTMNQVIFGGKININVFFKASDFAYSQEFGIYKV